MWIKNNGLIKLMIFLVIFFCNGIFAEEKPKAKIDTTFVNVIDFKNGRFSPDIELAIDYKDGKLNLFTRSKTVGEIFKEIEKKAKIEIKVDEETAQKKVSIFVNNKTLKEGIEAILNSIGQRDLAIGYKEKEGDKGKGKYEISTIEIRKRNKEEMAKIEADEEKQRKEEYARQEKAYHELFKDMGKKGKLAGMLKDYAEGKRGTGINTYLRQADIKPEEKPLLREAYFNPKYSELGMAIEMGLIHAIGDKPEESDKEFLLELLKKKQIGFLMYSMKFIWDEKFIPGLIGIVEDTTLSTQIHSTAAEILGFRRVKEAIPALEEAMLNCSDCTHILVALRSITGLNYYVENGKVKTTTKPPKLAPDIELELKKFKEDLEKKNGGEKK